MTCQQPECECVRVQDAVLRCDVNVSVRKQGEERLGTRVEVKNMNSLSAIQKAVDFELARQVCVPVFAYVCGSGKGGKGRAAEGRRRVRYF